jgi:uroporphyrinogen decarboxylase
MPFLKALKGENRGRPPVWLMRQAGRYMSSYRNLRQKHDFLTLCHDPELVTEVTMLPIRQFGMDAAIIFSDILMVPEAMGFQVRFEEGAGPIIDNPVAPFQSLKYQPERQAYLPAAISLLKNALQKTPLIGFAGAPFTLACYVIEGRTSKDYRKVKEWIYRHPEAFTALIDQLTDGVIASLKLQKECDALQLFDSWAHLLPLELFQQYCLKPLRKIRQAVKEIERPLIYFCKGSCLFAQEIAEAGIQAISLDHSLPPQRIRSKLPTITLQGNLDPEALMAPSKTVEKLTREILLGMQNDPAYIFNLGHGILPNTQEDAVRTLVDCVKNSP